MNHICTGSSPYVCSWCVLSVFDGLIQSKNKNNIFKNKKWHIKQEDFYKYNIFVLRLSQLIGCWQNTSRTNIWRTVCTNVISAIEVTTKWLYFYGTNHICTGSSPYVCSWCVLSVFDELIQSRNENNIHNNKEICKTFSENFLTFHTDLGCRIVYLW